MNREYIVHTHTTGFFTGALSGKKLQDVLNRYGAEGWRLVRTIHEEKKWLILFGREAHFLIFEREY
jgi:hypothetical protein